MVQQLNAAESELYGRTVEALDSLMRSWLSYEPSSVVRDGAEVQLPLPYFYHNHMGVGEDSASIFSALGILSPLTTYPYECIFTFQIEHDAVYDHAVSCATEGPTLPDVLSAYFSFASDYDGGFGVRRNETFSIRTDLKPLFGALNGLGYVDRRNDEYSWTDKIFPIMRSALIWNEEGVPILDDWLRSKS